MTDSYSDILAELNLAQAPSELPNELFAILIDEIEDAISRGTKQDLEVLRILLVSTYDRFLREAPVDAASAILGLVDDASNDFAYLLGRLGFAQQLVSQVSLRRADDAALKLLTQSKFKPYFAALRRGELTGVQLAEKLGQKAETVSRNLVILRQNGLVGCRRDGTRLFNYLTPLAEESIESLSDSDAVAMPKVSPQQRAVRRIQKTVSDRFSARPVIAIHRYLG